MKVLFATPECAPLSKTGGLGDVSAALPAALRELGVDVRVLLPAYRSVLEANRAAPELARLSVLGQPVRLLDAHLPGGVPLILIDCPALFNRTGGPYQTDAGDDWKDNALRFGVLSKMAAMIGGAASPIAWRPDVVHCNDWPTALAPTYLRLEGGGVAGSLITIHNLAFQGMFGRDQVAGLELPDMVLGTNGLELFGRISFLKGALVHADAINTVSPTYAREIQGKELGFGLDGVLRGRTSVLHGILNGIDTALWDPRIDTHIPSRYGPETLEAKAANARALRKKMGLREAPERMLAGLVSRLTHQKGIDLITEAADGLIAAGFQLAVVGTGDRELVAGLKTAAARHPDDFVVRVAFDEALAHLIEAGSDLFLMPSRFEPCGMNQMYSQRYGTPPLANATGGLVDTITDADPGRTGFLMTEATSAALLTTARRALAAWRVPATWRAIQLAGMSRDFGWPASAHRYLTLYERLKPR